MTLFQVYNNSLSKLKNPDIDEINIRMLLCEINGLKTMSDFYLHINENIKDLNRFNEELQRFLNGEPIQYIIGKALFFNNEFTVNKNVLIPRNETEEVVQSAIENITAIFGDKKIIIADVCCGSGCIGVSLYKNCNVEKILFSDLSKDALDVAKLNASKFSVNASFYESDCLEYLNDCKMIPDVVIANPPYILNRNDVDKSVLDYEPHMALFADKNLTIYKKIINTAVAHGIKLLVFEIGYDLYEKLNSFCKNFETTYEVKFLKDINKHYRILLFIKK